jgi:3-isopropylmalate/(R)-2-methylmalate dehydratase large subunit
MQKLIKLDPHKRILFLTKDLELIKEQLYNNLNLLMSDLKPGDLLDDINTDVMTPAWVCFHHEPHEIARRAYAGLLDNNERVFKDSALYLGNFEAIVSGERKGTGSSRETAAQCEKYSGINLIFAASFAPIHERNNINLGQIMGNYDLLIRLQRGEEIPIEEFIYKLDSFSQQIILAGGLFNFLHNYSRDNNNNNNKISQPFTMAQKIMAKKLLHNDFAALINNESMVAHVDGGYSHEFTSAQVHSFLKREYGPHYTIKNNNKYAAFEDHLVYADEVKKYAAFMPLIHELRAQQKDFIKHNNIKDYSAKDGISPGICHELAREEMLLPGDFIQATDSHTCMGGALNAFAFGVGATEYAALLATGLAVVHLPSSIRFDLKGSLSESVSAKDIMLFILNNYSKEGLTLKHILEFGGEAMHNLSIDERATLCNMATECGAKTGICEPDQRLVHWLLEKRPALDKSTIENLFTWPDANCTYHARYTIDLSLIKPMLALPHDPSNGALVADFLDTPIDIAYGGSCTAGKYDDIDMYAKVTHHALEKGLTLPTHVRFYIQYGSYNVADYAAKNGHHELFMRAGINVIAPGCGACIGCGPGVSSSVDQITISAINRNFAGRSGPGKLYLASPLTVAASAFAGKICSWQP